MRSGCPAAGPLPYDPSAPTGRAYRRIGAVVVHEQRRGAEDVGVVDQPFTFPKPCSHPRILVLQRGEELPYFSASGMYSPHQKWSPDL
jgi:hypothetical protein